MRKLQKICLIQCQWGAEGEIDVFIEPQSLQIAFLSVTRWFSEDSLPSHVVDRAYP